MSNHVHLVFRSVGKLPPEQILGDFKRFTSKAIVKAIAQNVKESRRELLLSVFRRNGEKTSNVKTNQFWRHDNQPIELFSHSVFCQKINYIHNNPVKGGIVFRPADYVYSSAIDYSGEKGLLEGVVVGLD